MAAVAVASSSRSFIFLAVSTYSKETFRWAKQNYKRHRYIVVPDTVLKLSLLRRDPIGWKMPVNMTIQWYDT